MLIDLRDLLSGNKDEMTVAASIEMEQFDTSVNCYDIVKKEPIELKLVKLGKTKFSVQGESKLTLSIPCDRCLEPVNTPIAYAVDRVADIASEELIEDEEQDFIDGYNLDIDKLLFGEILLNIPGKVLCKESCKGLCSVCGTNLNLRDCGCVQESLDPRMSVFKDILLNDKEV
ncbi:MAG: YceD family protein [Lachnospira sp.]